MITLSQYLGFIFREVSRGRQIADAEALRIAKEYAKDPLLKFLSVPRFKIPEMDLSVPVVISGAQFRNTLVFQLSEAGWVDAVSAQAQAVLDAIASAVEKEGALLPPAEFRDVAFDKLRNQIRRAHERLAAMPDEATLESAIEEKSNTAQDAFKRTMGALFDTLPEYGKAYSRHFESDRPVQQGSASLRKLVASRVVVSSSTLESLLVSPETNIVRNEGSPISVFQIRARITEEGVSVRSVGGEGGQATPVVDID